MFPSVRRVRLEFPIPRVLPQITGAIGHFLEFPNNSVERDGKGLIRVARPYDVFVTFGGYTRPENATPAPRELEWIIHGGFCRSRTLPGVGRMVIRE